MCDRADMMGAALSACNAETGPQICCRAGDTTIALPFAVHHFCAADGAGRPLAALHDDHLQTLDIKYSCRSSFLGTGAVALQRQTDESAATATCHLCLTA